jgi:tetratricopeptide (TPR) repeat protein
MDYRTASEEYLRWLSQNPSQIGFVQGRMATFTDREEGRAAAIQIVRQAVQQNENVRVFELLEWLYMEGRQYEEAFAVAHKTDALLGAHGGAIMAFADRAFTNRVFDLAARAYREAIDIPLPKEKLPVARYGYARSLHEAGVTADSVRGVAPTHPPSEAIPRYADAIAEYEKIIADYPLSEFSTRSHFQIGVLQLEKYFDLDAALSSFEAAIRESGGNSGLRWEAALRAGAVLLARGDTLRARDRFLAVGAASDALPEQSDEASFRLAEIDFFSGLHEAARDRLDALVVNLKADYANDAIQLQAFLQENAITVPSALVQFGKAEFLARQHRYSEAIQRFANIVREYPTALLVDDALLRIASLEEASGRFGEAAAAYERLLNEFKERSSVLDKAMFRLGQVYEIRLDTQPKAIAVYEQLLAAHPTSLFAAEARKRIRRLRGETL